MNKSASAMAIDVTMCHGFVAMRTLNFVRMLQELESFDVAH